MNFFLRKKNKSTTTRDEYISPCGEREVAIDIYFTVTFWQIEQHNIYFVTSCIAFAKY